MNEIQSLNEIHSTCHSGPLLVEIKFIYPTIRKTRLAGVPCWLCCMCELSMSDSTDRCCDQASAPGKPFKATRAAKDEQYRKLRQGWKEGISLTDEITWDVYKLKPQGRLVHHSLLFTSGSSPCQGFTIELHVIDDQVVSSVCD